jgi:putative ABC transport system substrate-binding protein
MLRPLAAATNTVPIVAVGSIPPNLFASYARPGGNITGVQSGADGLQIYAKQVEVLGSILKPRARVAWLGPKDLWETANGDAARKAATAKGLELQPIFVSSPVDKPAIREAFSKLARLKCDAVLVSPAVELFPYRDSIAELAISQKLPSIGNGRFWAEAGTLLSYGSDLEHAYRRAANQVNTILKGRAPAVIPIEQSDQIDLAINLQTAKIVGVVVPQAMLVRADKVIQ